MQNSLLLSLIATSVFLAPSSRREAKQYRSKDGHRVSVHDFSQPKPTDESKIEFYSVENRALCILDYTSEDGEHGFGVVKAAWTPDQKYFVFSLTSSGGHQSWHAPTLFYNVEDNAIHMLDSYVDGGISKADFVLKAPNQVLTEVWRGQSQPIKFRLDSLTASQKAPRTLPCVDGRVFKPDS